jgi:hypothetical protein
MSQDHQNQIVYLSKNRLAAKLMAEWLTDQGVPALLHTESNLLFPMQSWATHLLGVGRTQEYTVQVPYWVDLDEVKRLLQEHKEDLLLAAQERQARTPEVIQLVCEACGHECQFSGDLQGTVQECPRCLEFLDLPGDEDEIFDWSSAEELDPEDDTPDQETDLPEKEEI